MLISMFWVFIYVLIFHFIEKVQENWPGGIIVILKCLISEVEVF